MNTIKIPRYTSPAGGMIVDFCGSGIRPCTEVPNVAAKAAEKSTAPLPQRDKFPIKS